MGFTIQNLQPVSNFRLSAHKSSLAFMSTSDGVETRLQDPMGQAFSLAGEEHIDTYGDEVTIAFTAFSQPYEFTLQKHTNILNVRVIGEKNSIIPLMVPESTYKASYIDDNGEDAVALLTISRRQLEPEEMAVRAQYQQQQQQQQQQGVHSTAAQQDTPVPTPSVPLYTERVSLFLSQNNDVIHLSSPELLQHTAGSTVQSLSMQSLAAGGLGLLAYRDSDQGRSDSESSASAVRCGAIDEDGMIHEEDLPSTHRDLSFVTPTSASTSTSPASPLSMTPQALTRWKDCFPDPHRLYTINTAGYVDYGFYSMLTSVDNVVHLWQHTILISNEILRQQLNMVVAIRDLVILTTPDASHYVFNSSSRFAEDSRCGEQSTGNYLSLFTNWVYQYHHNKYGMYFAATDCFSPGASSNGLAFNRSVCRAMSSPASFGYLDPEPNPSVYGKGFLLNYIERFYLLFLHEFGHTLGAAHSYTYGVDPPPGGGENKTYQGKVGGVMDNGRIVEINPATGEEQLDHGMYGYNYLTDHEDVCKYLRNIRNQYVGTLATDCLNVDQTGYENPEQDGAIGTPVCGNGIIDVNEDCDHGGTPNACCLANCKLAPGAECDKPGTCCTDECKHKTFHTTCGSNESHMFFCYKNNSCKKGAYRNTCGLPTLEDDATPRQRCQYFSTNSNTQACTTIRAMNVGAVCPLSATETGICIRENPDDAYTVCAPRVHAWEAWEWGRCDCATRTRVRHVFCSDTIHDDIELISDFGTTRVSDSFCAHLEEPARSESCVPPAGECVEYVPPPPPEPTPDGGDGTDDEDNDGNTNSLPDTLQDEPQLVAAPLYQWYAYHRKTGYTKPDEKLYNNPANAISTRYANSFPRCTTCDDASAYTNRFVVCMDTSAQAIVEDSFCIYGDDGKPAGSFTCRCTQKQFCNYRYKLTSMDENPTVLVNVFAQQRDEEDEALAETLWGECQCSSKKDGIQTRRLVCVDGDDVIQDSEAGCLYMSYRPNEETRSCPCDHWEGPSDDDDDGKEDPEEKSSNGAGISTHPEAIALLLSLCTAVVMVASLMV